MRSDQPYSSFCPHVVVRTKGYCIDSEPSPAHIGFLRVLTLLECKDCSDLHSSYPGGVIDLTNYVRSEISADTYTRKDFAKTPSAERVN